MHRVYQLYATTSQANAASATIIANGVITAIAWACYIDSTADNATIQAELSFQSVSSLTTNGAIGIISACSIHQNQSATGIDEAGVNYFVGGLVIPVGVGAVIYLNTNNVGGIVKVNMYVLER